MSERLPYAVGCPIWLENEPALEGLPSIVVYKPTQGWRGVAFPEFDLYSQWLGFGETDGQFVGNWWPNDG